MRNEIDPKAVLRRLVGMYGTQAAASAVLKVSPAYFCDLLAGRREASARVLEMIGLRRIVVESERNTRARSSNKVTAK